MGTSLTEEGVRELRRLADAVLLLLRRRRGRPGGGAARHGDRRAQRPAGADRGAARPARTRPTSWRAAPRRSRRRWRPRSRCWRSASAARSMLAKAPRRAPTPPTQACRSILAAAAPGPERDEQVRLRVERAAARCRLRRGARARPPRGPRMPDTSLSQVAARPAPEGATTACSPHRWSRGCAPEESDASPLATWVRARIAGHGRRRCPTGLEGDAASVLTLHRRLRRRRRRTRRGAGRRRELPPRRTYHRDR